MRRKRVRMYALEAAAEILRVSADVLEEYAEETDAGRLFGERRYFWDGDIRAYRNYVSKLRKGKLRPVAAGEAQPKVPAEMIKGVYIDRDGTFKHGCGGVLGYISYSEGGGRERKYKCCSCSENIYITPGMQERIPGLRRYASF